MSYYLDRLARTDSKWRPVPLKRDGFLIPNLIGKYLCGAKNGKKICYRILDCREMGVKVPKVMISHERLFRSKQTRQTNNFSVLFWCGFFSSTRRSPQTFSKVFSPSRMMAWAMSHMILVSQYCIAGLTILVGWFPWQVCYLCGLLENLHQRDFLDAVAKKMFKAKWA